MQRLKRTAAALGVAISVLIGGGTLAADAGESQSPAFTGPPPGGRGLPPPPPYAGQLLAKAMQDQMTLQVLVALTGESAEEVAAALAERSTREVLVSYGVAEDAFRAAMDARLKTVAEQAAGCGLISEEQAAAIAEWAENHPAPGLGGQGN